jgi:type I restriction enzyme, S subunit
MTTSRLDQVCDLIMGQAPNGESYNLEHRGWPLIAGAGDFSGTYPKANKYTTEATKLSKQGDIILGIRASIGEKVLSDREYCLGRGVAGLRVRTGLDSKYLWHWLSHIRPQLENKSKGATFKQVNREDIGELEINLPPLSEQRRIAEILDKTEELRAKRRAALALLDTLTQSIFYEMFGDPVENNRKWHEEQLLKVCENITDGTHDTPPRIESGVPFITSKNIRSFEIDLSNLEFVSMETHHEIIKRCNPRKGDILYTNIGVNIGNAVVNQLTFEFSLKNVALIQPNYSLLDSFFLEALLNHEQFKRSILNVSSSGGAQKFVALQALRKINVPIPPLTLQKEFTQHVKAVNKLKAAHCASLDKLDELFASLQYRAFRGEL